MKTKTKTPAKKAMKKTAVKSSRPASRIVKSSKESLEDIFEDMLKDIYWAENHLAKALTKMAKASFNEDLKEAFEGHLKETKGQITRLEQCFTLLGMKAQGKKCPAMQGLVEEGQEAIDDHEAGLDSHGASARRTAGGTQTGGRGAQVRLRAQGSGLWDDPGAGRSPTRIEKR